VCFDGVVSCTGCGVIPEMKKLILLGLLLLPAVGRAEQTKTLFNPFTGKFDYITALSTNSIQAGTGVTVSTTTSGVSITATGHRHYA
jgi:hypothetical protein